MRILFFGTYDASLNPRVAVWKEGFEAHGDEVIECNVPLALDTAARVRILRKPWLIPFLGFRLVQAWTGLLLKARSYATPDVVAVGYMGHFDIHLARCLWRNTPIVLDHLVSARETASDRGITSPNLLNLLGWFDRVALEQADYCCVDTEEHLELIPAEMLPKALVARVGATNASFCEPSGHISKPLRVVFFGSYTPLQGAPVIGQAIRLLADSFNEIEFTMVGTGQDFAKAKAAADGCNGVTWIDWVSPADLPAFLNSFDVCLGIFGTGPKAKQVVPNKVFQGAAGGCAIVTSDTSPQRKALAHAGVFVPPGSPERLAEALAGLAQHPERVLGLRQAAYDRAKSEFVPYTCVQPLRDALQERLRT